MKGALTYSYNIVRGYAKNFIFFALPPGLFTYALMSWAKKADEEDTRKNAH